MLSVELQFIADMLHKEGIQLDVADEAAEISQRVKQGIYQHAVREISILYSE